MTEMGKKKDHDPYLQILDAIDGAIYLADPDTFEVLFTNKKFKSIWGEQDLDDGIKCFRLLHGMDVPCPFCTNEIIFNNKTGEVYNWEYRNSINKRWYRCYDSAVEWRNGKMVRMELAIDITREKNAIAESELARDRYELTESLVNIGIWDWRVEENEAYFSTIWKEQVGYKDNELSNSIETWTSLMHPDDRNRCTKALQDYLEQPKGKFILDFRLRHKNGHYIWIHNEANSKLDKDGKVIRILGAHADITTPKNSEIKLRLNEAKYRSVFESANDAFFIFSEDGKIVDSNQSASDVYGYSPDELIGKSAAELIHPDQKKFFNELVTEVWHHGLFRGEAINIRKDGTFPTQITGTLIMYEDEPHFLAVVRDVTETKQKEKQVLAEKLFNDSVLEAMPGIFYLFDEQGKFLKWNNTLADLSGIPFNEIGSRSPLDFIAKKHRNKVASAIDNAFRTGEVFVEADFLAKGRKNIPFYFSGIRVKFEDKSLLLGVGIDISKRKQAEQKLESVAEELRRSNIELERFASVASHDLQEPLRMVASYTQLLEKKYKDKIDDKASRYIHYAVDGAERMQILINDLLQYSRISTRGKSFTRIDMNEVVNLAVDNLLNRIQKSGAKLDIQELPQIDGDPAQLSRLFMNLIGNALKFAREGVQPEIKIAAARERGRWKFTVTDNGIGIDQKYEDKIFVIFQRLHSREDYNGTGIGLAICKRIVERHGGKIWFESENGTGTTFIFTLPSNVIKLKSQI